MRLISTKALQGGLFMKDTTKQLLKKALLFGLCILPIALIGGFFTGIYSFEHLDDAMSALVLEQMGSKELFYVVTTIQSAMYGFLTGAIGYVIASNIGLVKSFRFEASILKRTVPVIIFFGCLFACDYFVFGRIIPEVAADYEKGISPAYFLSSLTYGAVIEEILLRWFFMSAIAWILWKLFARKFEKADIPTWIFIVANILSAFAFAAGHIPATIAFFNGLNALILFRCFLLNGGFALLFGRYYRKYGIQYACLAHFGLHFVSKIILLIVI